MWVRGRPTKGARERGGRGQARMDGPCAASELFQTAAFRISESRLLSHLSLLLVRRACVPFLRKHGSRAANTQRDATGIRAAAANTRKRESNAANT